MSDSMRLFYMQIKTWPESHCSCSYIVVDCDQCMSSIYFSMFVCMFKWIVHWDSGPVVSPLQRQVYSPLFQQQNTSASRACWVDTSPHLHTVCVLTVGLTWRKPKEQTRTKSFFLWAWLLFWPLCCATESPVCSCNFEHFYSSMTN